MCGFNKQAVCKSCVEVGLNPGKYLIRIQPGKLPEHDYSGGVQCWIFKKN